MKCAQVAPPKLWRHHPVVAQHRATAFDTPDDYISLLFTGIYWGRTSTDSTVPSVKKERTSQVKSDNVQKKHSRSGHFWSFSQTACEAGGEKATGAGPESALKTHQKLHDTHIYSDIFRSFTFHLSIILDPKTSNSPQIKISGSLNIGLAMASLVRRTAPWTTPALFSTRRAVLSQIEVIWNQNKPNSYKLSVKLYQIIIYLWSTSQIRSS